MKKTIILGFLCLMAANSFAQKLKLDFNETSKKDEQVSPIVRDKIEEYAIEIRQIVIDHKLAMQKEIAKVDEDLQNGIITQSEADNLKTEIAYRFSDKINSDIQNLKFNVDELTKQQVQFTIMNTDLNELKKEQEAKTQQKRSYKPINEMVGYFSFGMISLPDGSNQQLNQHLGYSSGIDLGLLYQRQFTKTSPFVMITGAYLSWRTVRFDDNRMINRDLDGNIELIQHPHHLDKSKLRSTYIMVPLGVKYSTSPLRTRNDEAYRNPNRGIAISANVYGGFLISNNNIVKGGEINQRDKKSNYRLNNVAYGAQLTLSIRSLNFFVRQEFSPFFKNTFDERKMTQFGLNLGF